MSSTTTMSMSDTSTSRSSSKLEAAVIHEEAPASPRVRRQSKLKGMLVRSIHGTTGAATLPANSGHTASNESATTNKVTVTRPILENQESLRIQNEHAGIMKRIEATTAKARKDMEKIRKESLLKENKVRAEIEQLTRELNQIEMDEAKRIKAVQAREANELEKLVKELKRI